MECTLPWMQWLSFEECCAYGFNEWVTKIALLVLHDSKCLDVRVRTDTELTIKNQELISQLGFDFATVTFHEVRLTKRSNRLRKRVWKWFSSEPELVYTPIRT
jgi:hypothetical protein